jgi:hypothetical protein
MSERMSSRSSKRQVSEAHVRVAILDRFVYLEQIDLA